MTTKLCSGCGLDKPATLEFWSGDKRKPSGIQGPCRDCMRATWKRRYREDAEFRKKHINHVLKGQIEKPAANNARHYRWAKRHPHKANARWAMRHAQKLMATPSWLTKEQMKEIELVYAHAQAASKALGEKHSVDHIIPLRGENVRGLHVPWNLQVLSATENSAKGKRVG